jgi:hypothetical protein
MLEQRPPPRVRRLIRQRMAATHHTMSAAALRQGDAWRAWRAHLRSLSIAWGWRYMTYSRHLLHPRFLFGRRRKSGAPVAEAGTACANGPNPRDGVPARKRIPRNA